MIRAGMQTRTVLSGHKPFLFGISLDRFFKFQSSLSMASDTPQTLWLVHSRCRWAAPPGQAHLTGISALTAPRWGRKGFLKLPQK